MYRMIAKLSQPQLHRQPPAIVGAIDVVNHSKEPKSISYDVDGFFLSLHPNKHFVAGSNCQALSLLFLSRVASCAIASAINSE